MRFCDDVCTCWTRYNFSPGCSCRHQQLHLRGGLRWKTQKKIDVWRNALEWTWLSNVAFTIPVPDILEFRKKSHAHNLLKIVQTILQRHCVKIARAQSLQGSTPSQTYWHWGSKVSKPRFLNSVTLSQIDWSRQGFPVMLALAPMKTTFQILSG